MAESSGVLRVEVVSPERVLFSGESTQVITRTMEGGEIAFLPGHAAFLGALTENHTRIYLSDGTIQNLAVHLGFVEVGPDHVTILSDAAELEEDIELPQCVQQRFVLKNNCVQSTQLKLKLNCAAHTLASPLPADCRHWPNGLADYRGLSCNR